MTAMSILITYKMKRVDIVIILFISKHHITYISSFYLIKSTILKK